ncbi:MAG: prolipoprotein diacylglyceryl transferase, partial [Clostridia bacterium]|nr:prolipoprotein diacylglyceryl transferase [Clostridia bacterium]
MVLIGLICFTVCTITIVEKIEKYNEKVTNRFLIVSAIGFVSLVAFAFIFNSIFHSIKNGKLTLGGITWLGGVLGSFPFMIFLIRKYCPVLREKPLESFNFLMPGIVIAHCFGRIGCFLGGCCYGSVTDSIFGVSFPKGSNASIDYPGPDGNSLPVHPTQLYEAVFGLILFIVMISLYKKLKKYYLELYLFS